jgi:hypothetical protein
VIDTPSTFKRIRKVATLVRVLPTFEFRVTRTPYGGSGIVHGWVVEAELLKL